MFLIFSRTEAAAIVDTLAARGIVASITGGYRRGSHGVLGNLG